MSKQNSCLQSQKLVSHCWPACPSKVNFEIAGREQVDSPGMHYDQMFEKHL